MANKKRKRGGRKALSSDEKQNRIKWKELVTEVFRKGRRPRSNDIANETNLLLKEASYTERVSFAQVNHWCAKPSSQAERPDIRTPKNQPLANAFVVSLMSLGTWDGINPEDAEEDQECLITLLGFEVRLKALLSGRNSVTQGDLATHEGAAVKTLRNSLSMHVLEHDPALLTIHIYTSLSLHMTKWGILSEIIQDAVEQGAQLLIVLDDIWRDQYILEPLIQECKDMVERRRLGQENTDISDRLWYLALPTSDVPRLQTRFCRVGVLSLLPQYISLGERNGLKSLLFAPVLDYWTDHIDQVQWAERIEKSHWARSQYPDLLKPFLADIYRHTENNTKIKVERIIKES